MTRRGHVPVRTCLGCAGRSPQAEMVRLYRDGLGRLVPDWSRCGGGRGGYLHESAACWTRFSRGKGMIRSLGMAVDRAARVAFVEQSQLAVDR